MRLINVDTLEFKEFRESQIPKYAILSHTWHDGEEMTYQDMTAARRPRKPGYEKIVETCRLAQRENLCYAWVDTCCIDKGSSAELTESINSMYRWYKNAAVCFVHLSDLSPDWEAIGFEAALRKCRWTTRGWTLQEMIAPSNLYFHDANWRRVGSKQTLAEELSRVTLVPYHVLSGQLGLDLYSVAIKMSWAARRETTRPEDIAYCLLGIFDVNMPLIYGEGTKAFFRLQEEIVRHDNDLTIFAWNADDQGAAFCSVFAPSPAVFVDSKDIHAPSRRSFDFEFAISNKGLRVDMPLVQLDLSITPKCVLPVGSIDTGSSQVYAMISLHIASPNIYFRCAEPLIRTWDANVFDAITTRSVYYIDIKPSRLPRHYTALLKDFRINAIYLSKQCQYLTRWRSYSPMTMWDPDDACFFYSSDYGSVCSLVITAVIDGATLDFLVMFPQIGAVRNVAVAIVRCQDCLSLVDLLKGQGPRRDQLRWSQLVHDFPIISRLSEKTTVVVGGQSFLASINILQREGHRVAEFRLTHGTLPPALGDTDVPLRRRE